MMTPEAFRAIADAGSKTLTPEEMNSVCNYMRDLMITRGFDLAEIHIESLDSGWRMANDLGVYVQ